MKLNQEELSDEWNNILAIKEKEHKRVILYNTSVGTLLEKREMVLRKMREVFTLFQKKRDEIILLWRPHPLIKPTISALYPQLWKDYECLMLQFQEERWGIYDDSPDIDQAIAVSDGYYGDMSSVVQLCQKIGMPVLIQEIK